MTTRRRGKSERVSGDADTEESGNDRGDCRRTSFIKSH
jgi:hypothetical protein